MTYDEFLKEWADANEYVSCQTSGSTGSPKQIMLSKKEMERSAMRTIKFLNLRECSHFHSCISPDYIGGKMMLVRKELTGGTLTWEDPTNRPLSAYSGGAIDLLAVVPSQMLHILDHIDSLPEIRNILIGGAPIPPNLRERISYSGLKAFETYGMTETASHIALRKIMASSEAFMPLEGIKISTTSDSRLKIDIQGWQTIETNDIVKIDDGGRFEILGRADNVIITGGKKVHPEQVEEILESALNEEVLISSEHDDKWGEKVVLTLNQTSLYLKFHSVEDVMAVCKKLLPKECIPKLILINDIQHTSNGKKARRKNNNVQ